LKNAIAVHLQSVIDKTIDQYDHSYISIEEERKKKKNEIDGDDDDNNNK